MANQNESFNEEHVDPKLGNGIGGELKDRKKPFVEPLISVPVDVLEATTFFQAATSGSTN